MPFTHAHPTRFLPRLALAFLALFLASPAIDAARADAAQVTVVSPGGAAQTISLDALAGKEDVTSRAYTLRSASGAAQQTVSGFSLAAVLGAAGADPYAFSYLEVQRPAGGVVLLSRHQALDSGAFADGPPVLHTTASGTGFIRPNAGDEDLNASDSFEAPQGISVVLRKGTPLRVTAKASTTRTEPGKPVTFSATVAGAGAGEEVAISWYFDDGRRAEGASTRHRFAKRGSYDVVVGVTTPGNKTGASAVVTVQVGAPSDGPDRKGGGTNRSADAPDHGAAEGGGGPAGSGETTGVPAPAPSTVPGPAPAAPTPAPKQTRRQPPVEAGEPVTGVLLSSAETPLEAPQATPGARTGKLDENGDGPGLPDAALGLMVTVGLLGAGALVESRNLLR